MGIFSGNGARRTWRGPGRPGPGAKHGASTGIHSLLGQGGRFRGSARIAGTLRVDGAYEGDLEVTEGLVIGRSGELVGDVRARDVIVCGRLRGTVHAAHSIELQRGCHLEGDLQTRVLVVEEGVHFQGNCRMDEADPERGEPAGRAGGPAGRDARPRSAADGPPPQGGAGAGGRSR